ncbi:MAG: hypothetical protein ACE5G2_06205 [Candidatus Krumholzibacteriia bacterium]
MSVALWAGALVGRVRCPSWIRLQALNVLLGVALVLLLAAWPPWFFRSVGTLPSVAGDQTEVRLASAPGAVLQDDEVPSKLRNSRLFGRPVKRDPAPRRKKATLAELAAQVELRGVVGGENPKAILTNQATNRIHHLSKGQFIGELEILEISPHSVLLGWKGETLRLFL